MVSSPVQPTRRPTSPRARERSTSSNTTLTTLSPLPTTLSTPVSRDLEFTKRDAKPEMLDFPSLSSSPDGDKISGYPPSPVRASRNAISESSTSGFSSAANSNSSGFDLPSNLSRSSFSSTSQNLDTPSLTSSSEPDKPGPSKLNNATTLGQGDAYGHEEEPQPGHIGFGVGLPRPPTVTTSLSPSLDPTSTHTTPTGSSVPVLSPAQPIRQGATSGVSNASFHPHPHPRRAERWRHASDSILLQMKESSSPILNPEPSMLPILAHLHQPPLPPGRVITPPPLESLRARSDPLPLQQGLDPEGATPERYLETLRTVGGNDIGSFRKGLGLDLPGVRRKSGDSAGEGGMVSVSFNRRDEPEHTTTTEPYRARGESSAEGMGTSSRLGKNGIPIGSSGGGREMVQGEGEGEAWYNRPKREKGKRILLVGGEKGGEGLLSPVNLENGSGEKKRDKNIIEEAFVASLNGSPNPCSTPHHASTPDATSPDQLLHNQISPGGSGGSSSRQTHRFKSAHERPHALPEIGRTTSSDLFVTAFGDNGLTSGRAFDEKPAGGKSGHKAKFRKELRAQEGGLTTRRARVLGKNGDSDPKIQLLTDEEEERRPGEETAPPTARIEMLEFGSSATSTSSNIGSSAASTSSSSEIGEKLDDGSSVAATPPPDSTKFLDLPPTNAEIQAQAAATSLRRKSTSKSKKSRTKEDRKSPSTTDAQGAEIALIIPQVRNTGVLRPPGTFTTARHPPPLARRESRQAQAAKLLITDPRFDSISGDQLEQAAAGGDQIARAHLEDRRIRDRQHRRDTERVRRRSGSSLLSPEMGRLELPEIGDGRRSSLPTGDLGLEAILLPARRRSSGSRRGSDSSGGASGESEKKTANHVPPVSMASIPEDRSPTSSQFPHRRSESRIESSRPSMAKEEEKRRASDSQVVALHPTAHSLGIGIALTTLLKTGPLHTTELPIKLSRSANNTPEPELHLSPPAGSPSKSPVSAQFIPRPKFASRATSPSISPAQYLANTLPSTPESMNRANLTSMFSQPSSELFADVARLTSMQAAKDRARDAKAERLERERSLREQQKEAEDHASPRATAASRHLRQQSAEFSQALASLGIQSPSAPPTPASIQSSVYHTPPNPSSPRRDREETPDEKKARRETRRRQKAQLLHEETWKREMAGEDQASPRVRQMSQVGPTDNDEMEMLSPEQEEEKAWMTGN